MLPDIDVEAEIELIEQDKLDEINLIAASEVPTNEDNISEPDEQTEEDEDRN